LPNRQFSLTILEMTKNSKKLLFYGISIFFIAATLVIIFYCLGYRFDFENKTIVKTGGLYFSIAPPGATIYLDQRSYKKTNFFFKNAFLSGLLPKDYKITITKPDYHPWNKILTVGEEKVTEAKNIILFPKNPEFRFLAQKINEFFPAPGGQKLILKTGDKDGWALNYFDLQNQKQFEILNVQELQVLEAGGKSLTRQKTAKINFLNLHWSSDSKKILIEVNIDGEKRYLVVETTPEKNFFILDAENNIKKISFNPNNSGELFLIAPESKKPETSVQKSKEIKSGHQIIYRLKNGGKQIMLKISAPSFEQNIVSFSVLGNNILWLTDAGFLYLGRLINSEKIELLEILNLKPINVDKEANYQILAKDVSKILLKEDETLYYLNPESHLLEKIFNPVKAVEFSQDMKKIAVSTGNQIWLFYLEKKYEQPQREIGDKVLIADFGESIINLSWLNNHYLIFQIGNSIKIAEIDNRSKINLIELTTFPSLKIYWNQKQKTLLVLSEGNLYSCDNILR